MLHSFPDNSMSKSASPKRAVVRSRINSGLTPAMPFAPQPKSILRPKLWTAEVEEGTVYNLLFSIILHWNHIIE